MKTSLIAFAAIVVIALGAYVLATRTPATGIPNAAIATFSSPELGLAFDYPSGSTGYVVKEIPSTDASQGLIESIVVMRTEDSFKAPPVGGEAPPTITILVVKNTNKEQAANWATAHPQLSNSNLKTSSVTEAVVGGANAVRYTTDGLYAADTAVVAHGDNVYVFHGMYQDAESPIHTDFEPLLASVRFIPSPGQQ